MENEQLLKEVTAKAQVWLGEGYDEETRQEVKRMLDAEDKTELIESFYKDLEFGTGGLRGIMGATPELSFAIRHFGCQSGVNITASHNPKIYNGYKAYWEDGAQIIAPHDVNIIDHVNRIKSVKEIKFNGDKSKIQIIGADVDKIYLDKIKGLSLSPDVIERHKDLKIVYTPIHGTGVELIPASLRNYGFTNIIHVPEQDVPRRRPHRLRDPRQQRRVCAAQRQSDRDDPSELYHHPQQGAWSTQGQ